MASAVASSPSIESPGISLDDKISFLSAPENWPGQRSRVTRVETHHAWLFMTDCYVYKLKKPFRAGSISYSSLESRHRLCVDEYNLNRALAADTYLGVVPLVLTETGQLAVNGEGTAVEWLVKMHRLPESRTLTALALENRLTDAHVAKFVRKLARFHERAPVCRFAQGSYARQLRERLEFWHWELVHCRFGPPELLPALMAAQLEYVGTESGTLEARQRNSHVRSVHGDLRPEHVFILEDKEPQVIDCLEFDPELRKLDVAAELAYFAMECRHAGLPRVAARSVSEYHRCRPDTLGPEHLLNFYASLAATVRAGLMAWRSLETPGSGEWCERACAYLGAARHYIEKAR